MTRRCLLLVPTTFYSFARTIAEALTAAGYDVTVANDEYPANSLGKVLSKLDLPLARFLTRRAIERRFLAGRHYDLVAIFKGRGVGPRLVAALRQHADRIVGYHFDSLAYDPACRRWSGGLDRVCTFDPVDARTEGWPLVELFSMAAAPSPLPAQRIRVSAILRSHSQRIAYVDRVVAATGADASAIFFYEKDWLAWAWRAVRHPRLYWRWRRQISFTALPYDQYIDTLAASGFTIDFAHPKQSGLTIRCFEARALGTRVITNNSSVPHSAYFNADSAIVFAPGDDPAALAAAVTARLADERPEPKQRTVAEFIHEVIGTPTPARN